MMLTIGDKLPEFDLKAVDADNEFCRLNDKSFPGKWLVLFFYPMDFTFVCPTEIAEFGTRNGDFVAKEAQVLAASIDTHFVHRAWRNNDPSLKNLPFPMLADAKHELASALGVLHKEDGVALRATFIVDPEGVIRHVSVNDLDVGRNPEESLRILNALQTGELTPCNWQPGQAVLQEA